MKKNYCDKCHRLDVDVPVLILFEIHTTRYTNLKKILQEPFMKQDGLIFKSIGNTVPFTLCNDCFLSFMEHKKRFVGENADSGNEDESQPNASLDTTNPNPPKEA